MERSIEVIVAMLAILKAGGAYVPLDSESPKDRLEFLIGDIDSSVVLTQSHLANKIPKIAGVEVVSVDGDWNSKLSKLSDQRPDCVNQPEDMVYMIYTSGSTGQPKGCPNTHIGVANYRSE